MEKFFTCQEVIDLPSVLPEAAVWSRLGRNRFLSRIDARQELAVKLIMHRALALCKPRGRYCLLKISARNSEFIELANGTRLHSAAFAEFASKADFLWVGAVTVGSDICRVIGNGSGKLSESAVFDAVGSEAADLAIGVLQKIAAAELARFDLNLSKQRFSPGYGNLELTVQRDIFRWLKLSELEMTLNDNCIMQPEKSVTAFALVNTNK